MASMVESMQSSSESHHGLHMHKSNTTHIATHVEVVYFAATLLNWIFSHYRSWLPILIVEAACQIEYITTTCHLEAVCQIGTSFLQQIRSKAEARVYSIT